MQYLTVFDVIFAANCCELPLCHPILPVTKFHTFPSHFSPLTSHPFIASRVILFLVTNSRTCLPPEDCPLPTTNCQLIPLHLLKHVI